MLRAKFQEAEKLLILCGATFLVMAGQGVVGPVLPLYARDFGVSATMVGLTLTVFALARLILNIPAGLIADRFGSHGRGSGAADVGLAQCRLPKTMAMMASRACRSSIMIGRALSVSDMVKIVRRLKELEQPWNCPHGRPIIVQMSLDELDGRFERH